MLIAAPGSADATEDTTSEVPVVELTQVTTQGSDPEAYYVVYWVVELSRGSQAQGSDPLKPVVGP